MTPEEVRAEWLKRLRSGDYTQGTGVLRDDNDNYCCLGVLCQIAVEEGVIPEPALHKDKQWARYMYDQTTYLDGHVAGATTVLPMSVREWAGLAQDDGSYKDGENIRSLAWLNDTQNASFEEIADVIESEPDGLFKREES